MAALREEQRGSEGSATVVATVYDMSGNVEALRQSLSASVGKEVFMIPHVGVRVYGREYFYSDRIEWRRPAVMDEMLQDLPKVQYPLMSHREQVYLCTTRVMK